MEIQKQQSEKIFVGENLDVKDKVNKWVNAQVLGIQNGNVYMHYTGWHPKFDEVIPIDSGRVLKQWEPGRPIKLNNRVDVYHPVGGWLEARVIEIQQKNDNSQANKVKVHFFNFHSKYDMWVDLNDKNQVAIIGQKSKGYGMGKRKRTCNNQKVLSELARELLRQKLLKMIRQLNQNDFMMKQISGDGNCLFRAISDQLYGQETFHAQIRLLCMKYILQEKAFFQNYLVQDVEQYVERKSKDGVWGDDIQIQALSEIYARPIQIYISGIRPIRTFHEDNEQNIEPIRLAYIGQCHYNSIKKKSLENQGLMQNKFGDFQNTFLETYFAQKTSQLYWKNRNRDKFSHFNPLQLTIQERMEAQTAQNSQQFQYERDLMQQALQISQNEQISKQIEAAELRQLEKKAEQESLEKQLKKLEQQQLEQAKKLSKLNQFNQKSQFDRPFWFQDLKCMGFSEQQILFAIEIKGYDPEAVQNFLLDNM